MILRRHISFIAWILLLVLCGTGAAGGYDGWTQFPNMNVVTSLAESESEIFIGTTGGIRRFDRFFGQWKPPITTSHGLPSNRVRSLAYDVTTGELLVDTLDGSGAWHPQLESFHFGGGVDADLSPPIRIPPVVPPFGYYIEGHRIIGPRENYPITSAIIDSWDTLWLGTAGLGVGKARLADEQLEFFRYGPIEANVTALAIQGDDLWIGGGDLYRPRSHGITRYNTALEEWGYLEPETRSRALGDLRITDILPQEDHIWFSTRRGLVRYHLSRERWDVYPLPRSHPGGVHSLVRDGNRIWMGTEAGLALYDTQADSIRLVDDSKTFKIHGLSADRQTVWAATDQGLYRCNRGSATWKPVGGVMEITRRPALAVTAGAGGVWAAIESPPRVIHLDLEDPDSVGVRSTSMPAVWGSRHISIQADSARVWVGTEQGLLRLDRRRDEWKQFTADDGLLGEEVQILLLEGDALWIGTSEGLTRYRWSEDFFESN